MDDSEGLNMCVVYIIIIIIIWDSFRENFYNIITNNRVTKMLLV